MVVAHESLEHYLINMHALHNAHFLRSTLPCSLTIPIPFHDDNARQQAHASLANNLHISGDARHAATMAKASHTHELKKNLQALHTRDED
jgi:hypothetical protein